MIMLDTHAVIWWAIGSGLSKPARNAIEGELNEGGEIIISAMTAWEVTLLVKKGRLALATDVAGFFDKIARIDGVRFVPVDHNIASRSADLPGDFHKDPADRMIVATARSLSAPVVTKDRKIRDYQHVKTIW